ncbi:MAG: ComEC/Rec2 family competence protein [Candidatus Pacebacteria bacterium]|nr:ComEC/Rec2 family competence protein [Candidatus Paceibacterota bacterium]
MFFILISNSRWGIVACMFFVFFSLGILRFSYSDKEAPQVFESKVGTDVSLVGFIVDEPDIRENNQKLNIKIKEGKEQTKILVTTGFWDEFKYGDEVKIVGELLKPENFTTDTGKEFDYINYLRKDGILYVMNYSKVEIISSGHGFWLRDILFKIKNKFLEKINYAVSPPESTLLGGLILGERSSFEIDLRQKFIDTGTIHIIALSGYNVTIVAEWFMKLFAFLPQNIGIGVGIFAVILFVLMSGANSTAIRAGIMAILVLIARATGRNYYVARALILAGIIMILFNPFILRYDVSFQLSFIATVAVIFLTPRIEKHFIWITKSFGLRDIVSVTFSAYIFVLPFILYKMGNLSFVALPANILILPFIPFTMLLGFLTGFSGLFSYFLSIPFGLASTILLKYELGVIDILSNFSFASFSIPNFPLVITIVIYAYFIYFLFGRNIKKFFSEIE